MLAVACLFTGKTHRFVAINLRLNKILASPLAFFPVTLRENTITIMLPVDFLCGFLLPALNTVGLPSISLEPTGHAEPFTHLLTAVQCNGQITFHYAHNSLFVALLTVLNAASGPRKSPCLSSHGRAKFGLHATARALPQHGLSSRCLH
jgi:hypothetical protein